MIRYGIWVTFLLAVQLSFVLGRNEFYEYYYNKYHHKSHSTTEALSSSTAEISTEQKIGSSVSGGDGSSESVDHSSTVDFELAKHKNKTSHSYGFNEYNENVIYDDGYTVKVGLIAGCCSIAFVIVSCCLFCCVWVCCRRNTFRRGFIIADRTPAVGPLQPAVGHHHPQHQAISNQYPPPYQEERAQLFPPQYQPQVMQRQYSPQQLPYQSQYSPQQPACQSQYSPTALQGHNPPEAPPAYEFPEKF